MFKKSFSTIFEAFEYSCKKNPLAEAVCFKDNNNYASITYQGLYTQTIALAGFLKKNNVNKNDPVAIILQNSRYWPVAFFALMRIGAVAIPLYPELEHEELRQLISHSECKIILTSGDNEHRIKEATEGIAITIVIVDCEEIFKNPDVREAEATQDFSFSHTASIVYTSGTTASPKGVILSHNNLLANVESLKQLNLITPDDCLICLLPLYHSYPFMVNLLLPLLNGNKISFPANLDFEEIINCIKKTRVTILLGVPRIFALFSEKIEQTIENLPLIKKIFLSNLLKLSSSLRITLHINLSKPILNGLHEKFGRDFRLMISGGAKLNKEVANNFYKWGFTLLEGYGLTEASPVVSFNTPDDFKIGSVGKPIPGVQVKINRQDRENIGEILVKGENVTCGYYKDALFSRQTIQDGWLFTRDLGYIDKGGFLFITGRKDETIVLSSGKKINPDDLEAYYAKDPHIKEICIFLPKAAKEKDLLTAVILPDLEYFRIQRIAQIKDNMRWVIENLSLGLPVYKRIKKYVLINEKLPKTVLGKVKRFEIENKYYENHQPQEAKEKTPELSPEDKKLLSLEICRKALEYLSRKTKRAVNLDDHLELDLGLDSLERIGLFFEFQKLVGLEIDEKSFFSVSTVRDVLNKLYYTSQVEIQKENTGLNWKKILSATAEKELNKDVAVKQGIFVKMINLIFICILFIISRLFFQLKVKGKENIPKDGPFIFCPNHSSYLDAPLFASSLGTVKLLKTYFLGYSFYINHPLLSWGKKLFRLIPLDPGSKLTDTLIVCSFVLQNSKALCMFPEGGRSIDGEIKEFKRGVGVFIKELDVNVVPAYIRGTHKAWPAARKLPSFGKVEIIFGNPLTVEYLTKKQIKDVDIYQNIANNLREELLKLQNREKPKKDNL